LIKFDNLIHYSQFIIFTFDDEEELYAMVFHHMQYKKELCSKKIIKTLQMELDIILE